MNIYGLDFTSAPSRKKPITCAVCEITHNSLKLNECLKLSSFTEFEAFLRWDGPWLAALDFPFGQPRKLITSLGWHVLDKPALYTWEGYVEMISSMGKKPFEEALLRYCASRSVGDKHALRRTDVRAGARSPMMLHRVPVAKMFFQGASRLLASGVSILPCRPTNDSRKVVEGYPALVARRWIGKCSYKSDDRARQTADKVAARQRILPVPCRQGNIPARRGNKCFFLSSDEPSCHLPSAESQFRHFPSPQSTGKAFGVIN